MSSTIETKNPNRGGKGNTQERREKFLKKAIDVHKNKYDYSVVDYKNTNTKIQIICLIHGEFFQTPHSHLAGRHCPKCGEIIKNIKKSKTTCGFVFQAKKVHNNKYSYSKTNYINNFTPVIITCSIHGDFLQSPNCHLSQKQGCPDCGGRKRKNRNEFIENAKRMHGNKYDYSKIEYVSNKRRVIIVCKKHGEFLQNPNNHLNGSGCPHCKSSKGEEKIRWWLENNNISYIFQKMFNDCRSQQTNRMLKFDFYIPAKNLLIEYDGEQHFRMGDFGSFKFTKNDLRDIQHRDKIKTDYAFCKNIKLLRIKYTKMKDVDNILDATFCS